MDKFIGHGFCSICGEILPVSEENAEIIMQDEYTGFPFHLYCEDCVKEINREIPDIDDAEINLEEATEEDVFEFIKNALKYMDSN